MLEESIITTIANRKGGVGKSSIIQWVTANLFHSTFNLHSQGFRILLVDLDDQMSLYDLRRQEMRSRDSLIEKLSKYYPKTAKFDAEYRLSNIFPVVCMGYEEYLKKLPSLKKEYDVIILDFRGALDPLSIKVLGTLNNIVVPIISDNKDIRVTLQFFKVLKDLKIKDVAWFLNKSQNTLKDKEILRVGDEMFSDVKPLRYKDTSEIVRIRHRPVFFNEHASTIIPCDDKNGSIATIKKFIVSGVLS